MRLDDGMTALTVAVALGIPSFLLVKACQGPTNRAEQDSQIVVQSLPNLESKTEEQTYEMVYRAIDFSETPNIPNTANKPEWDILALGSLVTHPELKAPSDPDNLKIFREAMQATFRNGATGLEVFVTPECKALYETNPEFRKKIEERIKIPENVYVVTPELRDALRTSNFSAFLPYDHFARAPKGLLTTYAVNSPVYIRAREEYNQKVTERDK